MSKPVARIRFIRFAWLAAGILLGFSAQAWAYSGDTIQDDIAREFSGATSYTIPLAPPTATPPKSIKCNATLQQEQNAGEIPSNEECYCPVGAAQPVCTEQPGSDCPNLLQIAESSPNAQYEDCTCPTGATTPQCTSYYDLCEDNLPYYQGSNNECTCSQTATSAVPECTSDYQICEDNAGQYENGNTTCSCNQNSTEPTCCTNNVVTVSTTVPGISVNSPKDGVGATFCANSQRSVENNAYGETCPADSGITVCAYGVCRNWTSSGDVMAGADDSYQLNNPSVTYSPTGSYWDWGYCDGPYQTGSCSGWFTIYEGPSTSFTGSSFILYNSSYTKYKQETTQSCVQE